MSLHLVAGIDFPSGSPTAAAPCFLLGVDSAGHWVVRETTGRRAGLFRTFGRNALAAYVLHDLVAAAVKPYVPRDAPGWYVAAGFLLYFGISYGLVRGLEKQGCSSSSDRAGEPSHARTPFTPPGPIQRRPHVIRQPRRQCSRLLPVPLRCGPGSRSGCRRG